jgi:hypothetical protein
VALGYVGRVWLRGRRLAAIPAAVRLVVHVLEAVLRRRALAAEDGDLVGEVVGPVGVRVAAAGQQGARDEVGLAFQHHGCCSGLVTSCLVAEIDPEICKSRLAYLHRRLLMRRRASGNSGRCWVAGERCRRQHLNLGRMAAPRAPIDGEEEHRRGAWGACDAGEPKGARGVAVKGSVREPAGGTIGGRAGR